VKQTANSNASGGASARAGYAGVAARGAYEPAYVYIANTIAEQIGSGVYRPGNQLPTEPQLRATFGVSPMTIRRAVHILLERGLVTTTQGKGTFVRSPDLGEAVFRLQEITDMWTEDDASVDVRLLEARIQPAMEDVAEMLELEPGDPVVYMRRLIVRGGMTLVYQMEHVVYDERRPLVETQLQITSLDGLLQAARGEGIPSGQLTVLAVSLTAAEAKLLKVPEGSPAFCLEHLFLDFDGQPVSWGRFLCRADQFRLTTHIGVPRPAAGEA
jgi:DNA-binding GntR family transcriptional regulator